MSARYVDRWRVRGSPQPFSMIGQRTYWFVLAADMGRLHDLCRRYFREPSGGKVDFRPALPYVTVAFVAAERWQSQHPPFARLGGVSLRVALFLVPVLRVRRRGGITWHDQVAHFVPYAFADAGWDVIVNQEIWGLPKDPGWITVLPPDANRPQAIRFAVETTTVARFGPGARARRQLVLELHRVEDESPAAAALSATAGVAQILARSVLARMRATRGIVLPSATMLVQTATSLFPGAPQLAVNLKQFRDVGDGEWACYQAITQLVHRTTWHGGARLLPGRFECLVQPLEGHPVLRDLGLRRRQPVALAFSTDYDAFVGAGPTLWEA
jgi:hypothetical protein